METNIANGAKFISKPLGNDKNVGLTTSIGSSSSESGGDKRAAICLGGDRGLGRSEVELVGLVAVAAERR
jgi:hypothetical protein